MDPTMQSAQLRYETFEKQDTVNGNFDVCFKFNDGQFIQTHQSLLISKSDAFIAMFNEKWNKKEYIEIGHNTFEEFKTFLKYCYLGASVINDENSLLLLDFAECYNIKSLKEECDDFLCGNTPCNHGLFYATINTDNIVSYLNTAKLYSLPKLTEKVKKFLTDQTAEVLKSEAFLTGEKGFVMEVANLDQISVTEDELFSGIIDWGKKRTANEIDREFALKNELKDILPLIRFPTMNAKFFAGTVVKEYGYFFTYAEIGNILLDSIEIKTSAKTVGYPHSSFSSIFRYKDPICINNKNRTDQHFKDALKTMELLRDRMPNLDEHIEKVKKMYNYTD